MRIRRAFVPSGVRCRLPGVKGRTPGGHGARLSMSGLTRTWWGRSCLWVQRLPYIRRLDAQVIAGGLKGLSKVPASVVCSPASLSGSSEGKGVNRYGGET
jgi:hypothetical protein